MSALDAVLWVALPYAAIAVFVVGHVWRYRYDQFGWTTRSSQLYENRLLRAGSPMFHVGILMVAGGHAVGLLVPATWLDAIGIHEHVYHVGATVLGSFAAVLTVAGLVILIYRRRTVAPVFIATTRMDKTMYVALAAALGFGALAVVQHQILGAGYDYRGSVSPWIRSILILRPDASLMAGVPLAFQIHVVSANLLFALWPFTRLVHVFSAPVGYLTRPYVVYRSRDQRLGTRSTRRGWERVERPGTRVR
ncbi:MAG TPA: respiratory nitrate reductase subunit gamma [Cellulomonas sp.]